MDDQDADKDSSYRHGIRFANATPAAIPRSRQNAAARYANEWIHSFPQEFVDSSSMSRTCERTEEADDHRHPKIIADRDFVCQQDQQKSDQE